MSISNRHEGHLSEDFKLAANHIIDHLKRGEERRHPDGLFMPIAYLYRHSLELLLKHIARLALTAGLISPGHDLNDCLERSHNLFQIWKHVRAAIRARWPDENQAVINNTQVLINDFQSIDKSGQNLRYGRDKQGQPSARRFPDAIELSEFRKVFAAVHNLLDSCATDFDEIIQVRAVTEDWP